jgi:hypothetical protein
MLGIACEGGSWIDQSVKRAGDPTNIKLYFDGVCVTGVMPKYGEQQHCASCCAQAFGCAAGSSAALCWVATACWQQCPAQVQENMLQQRIWQCTCVHICLQCWATTASWQPCQRNNGQLAQQPAGSSA